MLSLMHSAICITNPKRMLCSIMGITAGAAADHTGDKEIPYCLQIFTDSQTWS